MEIAAPRFTPTSARQRLDAELEASERDRERELNELQDDTLQALAALRVSLASALRRDSAGELEHAAEATVTQLGVEIKKLRGLFAEMSPEAQTSIRPRSSA